MVISRNKKNAFFDHFPIKNLCLATTFLWLLALRVPNISIFWHFSRLQIYFKQLIVKISISEICYLARIYKHFKGNIRIWAVFVKPKVVSIFFLVVFLKPKVVSSNISALWVVFFFFRNVSDAKNSCFLAKIHHKQGFKNSCQVGGRGHKFQNHGS